MQRADRLQLWIGETVQEAIFTFAFAAGLRDRVLPDRDISLVAFRDGGTWPSLGMQRPEELARHPAPVPLSPEILGQWSRCWDSLVAEEPSALNNLIAGGTGDPVCDRALRGHLTRFPDSRTGLTGPETLVLQHLPPEWTRSPYPVAHAMAKGPPEDRVGDQVLYERLVSLARTNRPLLEMRGDPSVMRGSEVRLTDFGAACLAGEANRIDSCGYEDRVGGVHLSTEAGRLWVRDGGRLRRV